MTGFEEKMAALRGRFLARAAEERALIAQALGTMDKGELRRLAHGLSGSAGTFGFDPLSADAQAVEEAVNAGAQDSEVRRLGSILLDRLDKLQAV